MNQSYLSVAKKIATFQRKPYRSFEPPQPLKSLGMQKHCEIIRDILLNVDITDFVENGVPIPDFTIVDVTTIHSINLGNIELYIDSAKKPFRLRVEEKYYNSIININKSDITIVHSPCLGDNNCPTGIVVPGRVFLA